MLKPARFRSTTSELRAPNTERHVVAAGELGGGTRRALCAGIDAVRAHFYASFDSNRADVGGEAMAAEFARIFEGQPDATIWADSGWFQF